MELRLNKTPIRTCKNFKINDIVIDNIELTNNVEKFDNIHILGLNNNIDVSYEVTKKRLKYGIGEEIEKENFEHANHKIKLNIKETAFIEIYNDFDKENSKLIDLIEIECKRGVKAKVLIKYKSNDDTENYHNGIIRAKCDENAELGVTFVNLLNTKSNNFESFESIIQDNANIKFNIIDFGGKYSISNYFSLLKRKQCKK